MYIPVFALLFLLVSCATPVIDPNTIAVKPLQYGIFEINGRTPQHVETTTQIPCQLGATFGVEFRITFPEGSRGRLPLDIVWLHPEIDAPHLGVTGGITREAPLPPIRPRAVSVEGMVLWTFSDPIELKSGQYELSIRVQGEDRVLHKQEFEVGSC